jgi:hypothetical protein
MRWRFLYTRQLQEQRREVLVMSERKHRVTAAEQKERQDALNVAFAMAAAQGYHHIIHTLLKAGADMHDNHDAALMMAAEQGHWGIVEYLLCRGADLHGDEAMNRALKGGNAKTVQVIADWTEERRQLKTRAQGLSPGHP